MSRTVDRPEPILMAIRKVKNAPEVAARIYWAHTTQDPLSGDYLDRSPFLAAEVDGKPADPYWLWTRRGREIDQAEYDYLLADRKWARDFAPDLPEANPTKPVKLTDIPIPFL